MTLRELRKTLHTELRYTHDEYTKHRQAHTCPNGCLARARFQERIRTLMFALECAGGRLRPVQGYYPWGPVEGA